MAAKDKKNQAQTGHLQEGFLIHKKTPEMIERLKEAGKRATVQIHQPVTLAWNQNNKENK